MVFALTYKPEMCAKATKVLADGESLAAVCDELDICRSTLYEWRDKYPEFGAAIKKGLQKSQRDWERKGREAMFDSKNFNSASWIFTMKNRFRDDYAEDKTEKSSTDTLVDKLIDKLCD